MDARDLNPVIHQRTRLQILVALYRNRRASFTDLRDGLDLTSGNLATHTGRLEEAGYLRTERVLARGGFEVQYVITPEGLEAFEAYLTGLRAVLAETGLAEPGL